MSNALELQNAPNAISPVELLRMAVQGGAGIDTLERLVKLQQDMMARDAEQQFNQALHAAQSEVKRVVPDATNPQTRSKYATFAKLDSVLRPIYTAKGFSLSFDTADGRTLDSMKVIAYLSHVAGHTRNYTIDVPCDGKGAKGNDMMTRTHAAGSGLSYGKRYLEGSIFNVTVGETNDDGNGASTMPDEQFIAYKEAIECADSGEELKKRYASGYRAAQKLGDQNSMRQIIECYEKRKGELR